MTDIDTASLEIAYRQVDNMAVALRAARAKLELYRTAHGGEYVGGMEYAALLALIDAALPDGKILGGKG